MVVYVEYVFLDNFFIDALLLLAARRTLKLNTKLLWLAIPALIGAGAALAVPLVSMIKGVLFCTRVLLGFILVALSGKFKNFKEYIFWLLSVYFLYVFIRRMRNGNLHSYRNKIRYPDYVRRVKTSCWILRFLLSCFIHIDKQNRKKDLR